MSKTRDGHEDKTSRTYPWLDLGTLNLGLGEVVVAPGKPPDPLRSSGKNVRCIRLGQEEEQHHPRKRRHPDQRPHGPRPPIGHCCKPANGRTKHRRRNGEDAPDDDHVVAHLRTPDIAHGRGTGSEGRRADEAGQEAEGEDAADVGGVDDAKVQPDEGEEGGDVDWTAADGRELGEWRPDHGACSPCQYRVSVWVTGLTMAVPGDQTYPGHNRPRTM